MQVGSETGNYCRMAHSEDELNEWKERFAFREMKKKRAREMNLYSWMDTVIDDFNSAEDGSTVVMNSVHSFCSQHLLP